MDFTTIGGVVNTTDTNKVADGKKHNTLGKEEFMTLLLKQLSYQDPLNPMDSTEFTSQLTQFTSLEELNNINDTLTNVLAFQQSMQNATVTNMIGKDVRVSGNSAYLNGTADMNYELLADAEIVNITIQDSSGRIVSSENLGTASAGSNNYIWHGQDSKGDQLSDGIYTFTVEALDNQGEPVSVVTGSTGNVTGVSFRDGMTYLVLDGGREVYLSDVQLVEEKNII